MEDGEHKDICLSLLHILCDCPIWVLFCMSFYGEFKSFIGNTIGQDQSLTIPLYGIYKAHKKAAKETAAKNRYVTFWLAKEHRLHILIIVLCCGK
jgi:hypothetical protein